MKARLRTVTAGTFDPFMNLALEEYLMKRTPQDAVILYLWRNEKTVVIGRNQDAFAECDVTALERDGGRLARRCSGGGAVFQDCGNLNFTFIAPPHIFDVPRQLGVVLSAVRAFGVEAVSSGRNDLTVQGRKFSGNAFRKTSDICSHHGTLMISVDTDKLSRYLRVSPDKLKSKGVASVRSRVVNLAQLRPKITAERMSERILEAFSAEYGGPAVEISADEMDWAALESLREKYASDRWRLGRAFPGETSVSSRFDWGGVEIRLLIENRRIAGCAIYSDALNESWIASIAKRLPGEELEEDSLRRALFAADQPADLREREDMALLLSEAVKKFAQPKE